MRITRRTVRLAQIATAVERHCRAAGVKVGEHVVDAAVNERIEEVARLMDVAPSLALRYAPKDFAVTLGEQILAQLRANRASMRPAVLPRALGRPSTLR